MARGELQRSWRAGSVRSRGLVPHGCGSQSRCPVVPRRIQKEPSGGGGMDLVDRLANTYTGVVHDVMRAMGMRDFTLPPEIRPLSPDQVVAGVVATVSGKV